MYVLERQKVTVNLKGIFQKACFSLTFVDRFARWVFGSAPRDVHVLKAHTSYNDIHRK